MARRHDTCARRLFRRSVDEARAWPDGLEAAGGVKTLLVWAHKEWTIGNVALVSSARDRICSRRDSMIGDGGKRTAAALAPRAFGSVVATCAVDPHP